MMDISVRMYCHGLGDCFLIRLADTKIVIDAGLVQRAAKKAKKLTAVINSLAEATDGHVDLLVVTHEHYDHVASWLLDESLEAWRRIRVDELWMAWTEDPSDAYAMQLRKTRQTAAKVVAQALAASEESTPLGQLAMQLAGNPTTESWMDQIQRFFTEVHRSKVRFCRPGEVVPLVHDQVNAIVLGPPRGDLLFKSDPTRSAPETYAMPFGDMAGRAGFLLGASPDAMAASAEFLGVDVKESDYLGRLRQSMGVTTPEPPFPAAFTVSPREVLSPEDSPRTAPLSPGQLALLRDYLTKEPDRQISDTRSEQAALLGLKLDSDTNNTSLALMFALPNGRTLLFPGDAQVGSWLSWSSQSYTLPPRPGQPSGESLTIDQLLRRVKFYKCGHHGSHNATLRERGLELMPEDLVAMVPVVHDEAVAAGWGQNLPLESIMKRLDEKTKGNYIRTDRVQKEIPPVFTCLEDEAGARYVEWIYQI